LTFLPIFLIYMEGWKLITYAKVFKVEFKILYLQVERHAKQDEIENRTNTSQ